jgi:rhodanese-related sulfurtransferase
LASVTASDAPDEYDGSDITPLALAEALRVREIALVDVREPYEWAIGHLLGARLVPLESIPQAVGSMDRDAELVVYCHHGMRSDMAARWLREQGFARVRNLIGGIDRWSVEIDPSIRRY